MKSRSIISVSFILLGLSLFACKVDMLFLESRYYGGGATWDFYPDNSYQYMERMEGGYVYKFSRGKWKQDGNKLLLINEVSDPSQLPTNIRTSPSNESDAQLVINILPKRNLHFTHLLTTTDLLNIELVIGKITYPLQNETNIIRLQKTVDKGYFRAYPKPNVERSSEILNDTLRSQYIDLRGSESKILSIDVDCNPMYFAQVKMTNDTLRIISKNKIKWHKIYLERPH
ncbi:MAG TPA: hypothetical protein VIN08_05220 [Ohtaekwangia sp.]|uniref:hypothetical protein n=1 Tax=Ohtaekwangia sp. TaxID=2066019 RepID=UPI002F944315